MEIELFSYCNRTCTFCPNHYVDRLSDNKILPLSVFKKIIKELVSYDYNNYISLSRYCEPLAFRDILDSRIAYIRKHLPKVNDKITNIKLTEAINQIENLTKGKIVNEKQVLTLMRYYELIKEIKNVHKG